MFSAVEEERAFLAIKIYIFHYIIQWLYDMHTEESCGISGCLRERRRFLPFSIINNLCVFISRYMREAFVKISYRLR